VQYLALEFIGPTDQIRGALTDRPMRKEQAMSLGTVFLIVLVLILLGVIPTWPHSRQWGYAPSGIVSIIVIVLLVMLLTGRL
jgi:hypothetical protein